MMISCCDERGFLVVVVAVEEEETGGDPLAGRWKKLGCRQGAPKEKVLHKARLGKIEARALQYWGHYDNKS